MAKAKAPSKPGTPTAKSAPITMTLVTEVGPADSPHTAPPSAPTPKAKARPVDTRQKTITIPLSPELEALLDSNSAEVKASWGFVPTQAQSITTLIDRLLKAAK